MHQRAFKIKSIMHHDEPISLLAPQSPTEIQPDRETAGSSYWSCCDRSSVAQAAWTLHSFAFPLLPAGLLSGLALPSSRVSTPCKMAHSKHKEGLLHVESVSVYQLLTFVLRTLSTLLVTGMPPSIMLGQHFIALVSSSAMVRARGRSHPLPSPHLCRTV
jgi:hypothetical protein